SFAATAQLLKGTRANIDRVYRYGPASFAMVLPESGPKEVNGMIRRLRRVARRAKPAEGEPGGPLPVYFGATFFPQCATTTEDLLKRAEVALRIADGTANRVQFDGAEAPEMPPVESLRHNEQPSEASDDASAETAGRPEADAALVPDSPAVHAVQAPKFAVDSVEREWNAEAPLTVLRSPRLQDALNSLVEKKGSDLELLDESLANALRHLDTTLNLIRSLKKRAA
ncbi:MAG TPA: diguanylate cyclase, partial [Dehalococcoidia bacterium]|nr:diguanylate cyclase [Dehalococcoidia bacterium]